MRLPRELRNKIYSYVFSSTRFLSGKKYISRTGTLRIHSAPHGFALLLSCRQANAEIGNTWLSQVLFCFESVEAMLDKLTNVSPETLSMIKHVRVMAYHLTISSARRRAIHTIAQALTLLPGLKLDRLTVLDPETPKLSHYTINHLVKYGCGWKELRYISRSSDFILYGRERLPPEDAPGRGYLPVLQPASWQWNLEARNGSDSGAAVTIYQSVGPNHPGSVLHAATRAKYPPSLPPDQDVIDFWPFDPKEYAKEALIVVNRGRDVDYEEKHGSHRVKYGDIRSRFPGKTWMQIKAEQNVWVNYPSYHKVQEEDEVLVDQYSHVDDYVWPTSLYHSFEEGP